MHQGKQGGYSKAKNGDGVCMVHDHICLMGQLEHDTVIALLHEMNM